MRDYPFPAESIKTEEPFEDAANLGLESEFGRHELTRAAIERRFAPLSEEKRNTILRTRALELSREPRPDERDEASLQVVEFMLSYDRYAIPSARVKEVRPLRELTPVPCTPPFIAGIINVRGQILSVLDIRTIFEIQQRGLTDLNKVIVVRYGDLEVGILADSILGVRRLPLEQIQPSLATLTGMKAEYLRGVTQDRVAIVDVEKLMTDRRILVDDQIEP